jgi:hypothetical protein
VRGASRDLADFTSSLFDARLREIQRGPVKSA